MGTTTATAIVPAWLFELDPELPLWIDAPLEVADAAESVLAAGAEVVMVLKTSAVLVVPSWDTTLSEVMTLVVKTSGVVVADVVGGAVVVAVSLDTVVGTKVVVGSALVVVVSAGAVVTGTVVWVADLVVSVSVADVVVSATEVGLGLAVELGIVLDDDVVAGAEDVDEASEEAAVAELVLMEVRLLLLDMVKDRLFECLDEVLMKEGAMLAKTEDDNVICRETS